MIEVVPDPLATAPLIVAKPVAAPAVKETLSSVNNALLCNCQRCTCCTRVSVTEIPDATLALTLFDNLVSLELEDISLDLATDYATVNAIVSKQLLICVS